MAYIRPDIGNCLAHTIPTKVQNMGNKFGGILDYTKPTKYGKYIWLLLQIKR